MIELCGESTHHVLLGIWDFGYSGGIAPTLEQNLCSIANLVVPLFICLIIGVIILKYFEKR